MIEAIVRFAPPGSSVDFSSLDVPTPAATIAISQKKNPIIRFRVRFKLKKSVEMRCGESINSLTFFVHTHQSLANQLEYAPLSLTPQFPFPVR